MTDQPTLKITWQNDQWVVSQRSDPTHHKSKGKDTWRACSYHSRLDHAVNWCLQRQLGGAQEEDLRALHELLKDIRRDLPKITADLLEHRTDVR